MEKNKLSKITYYMNEKLLRVILIILFHAT